MCSSAVYKTETNCALATTKLNRIAILCPGATCFAIDIILLLLLKVRGRYIP